MSVQGILRYDMTSGSWILQSATNFCYAVSVARMLALESERTKGCLNALTNNVGSISENTVSDKQHEIGNLFADVEEWYTKRIFSAMAMPFTGDSVTDSKLGVMHLVEMCIYLRPNMVSVATNTRKAVSEYDT